MTKKSSVGARLAIRITDDTLKLLEEVAAGQGKSESEIVREALEVFLQSYKKNENCYSLAKRLGIIGVAENLPKDLSKNKKYFRDFGK